MCIKLVKHWDKYTGMHGQQNVKIRGASSSSRGTGEIRRAITKCRGKGKRSSFPCPGHESLTGTAPFIISLGTGWKWMVSFTSRPLYSQEGTVAGWEFWRRQKSFASTGIWTSDCPVRSLVAMPTTLLRIRYKALYGFAISWIKLHNCHEAQLKFGMWDCNGEFVYLRTVKAYGTKGTATFSEWEWSPSRSGRFTIGI